MKEGIFEKIFSTASSSKKILKATIDSSSSSDPDSLSLSFVGDSYYEERD